MRLIIVLSILLLSGCNIKPVQIDKEKPVSEIYPYPRIYIVYWGPNGKGKVMAKSIKILDHQLIYEDAVTGKVDTALDCYKIRYITHRGCM